MTKILEPLLSILFVLALLVGVFKFLEKHFAQRQALVDAVARIDTLREEVAKSDRTAAGWRTAAQELRAANEALASQHAAALSAVEEELQAARAAVPATTLRAPPVSGPPELSWEACEALLAAPLAPCMDLLEQSR